MGNAETLLLIHDQKTEILELNCFLKQLVSADNQIYGAGPEIQHCPALLRGRTESAEHVDVYREPTEAADGGLIMLLGQNRGGNKDCYLLAIHDCFHNSTESDFGFAEAYIAAQQSIHGCGGFHIAFDVFNTAELITGFGVGEIVLELCLPGRIRGKCKTGLALLAVGMGCVTTLMPILTRFTFGALEYAAIWSILSTASNVGSLVATPLFGMVYDASGSYAPAMIASSAALALNLGLMVLCFRKK